jgi:hypothetical protein
METLLNQPSRNQRYIDMADINEFLSGAAELAKEYNITVADVIRAHQALELARRNNLYIDNGDAFDWQVARISALLQDLVDATRGREGFLDHCIEPGPETSRPF